MKSVIALSLAALAVADTQSYWGDAPVDPVTTTTTQWEDDPSKYTKTTTTTTTTPAVNTWEDVSKTTTTTKPVIHTITKTITYTKKDGHPVTKTITVTEPADATETVYTWEDVVSSTAADPVWSDAPVAGETTTVWADAPAPTAADPKTWVDAAIGECKVVTKTVTASTYIWVPSGDEAEHTWSDYVPAPSSTKADPTWSDYVAPTSTADPTWSDYVAPTSTTVDPTWSDYTVAPTTTGKPVTTTKGWTTSTTKTTTAAPKPTGAKCPNDAGKTLGSDGSCGASFSINCNVKATPGANSKFWQKTKGEKIPTLAQCLAICNENALCESVLYVQAAGSADDQLCWQTSGLGPVTGEGYAQIAYKTGGKGKCSASYNA